MLRDITIGQYYPSDSVLHKLDPRVKLAGTLLFVVSLFPYTNMTVYLITTLFLILMVTVSKVSWRYILKGLKPVMIIIFFTAFYNVLLTPGKNEIVTWGIIHISYVGLRKAFYMVLRLMYLIIGSSLMTYTTTPTKLTDGIEEALKPLNKLKVPVHEFAMMMSLALRFIPILMEEANKIINAQSARGADFEEGKFFERAKNMVSILIPLLVGATRRANDLALAMDARCYHGGEGRTKMKPLKYSKRDFAAYVIICAYFVMVLVCGHYNFLHINM